MDLKFVVIQTQLEQRTDDQFPNQMITMEQLKQE